MQLWALIIIIAQHIYVILISLTCLLIEAVSLSCSHQTLFKMMWHTAVFDPSSLLYSKISVIYLLLN